MRKSAVATAMSHTPRPAPAAWVGIDVSQHTLDACLLPADGRPRFRVFANDASGHAALRAWADEHARGSPLGFCLEIVCGGGDKTGDGNEREQPRNLR